MSFKNFKGQTENKEINPIYDKILESLINIQKYYPQLYKELNRDPQFEYDIAINQKYKRYAIKYLKFLNELIQQYQQIYYVPHRKGNTPIKLHPNFIIND